MILAQSEIREAVEKGEIVFDPPLQAKQWAEATVNLRLGTKFTKLKPSPGVKLSMTHGIGTILDSGLWVEDDYGTDKFGKKQSYCLDPDEFILALTYERIQMPRNLKGLSLSVRLNHILWFRWLDAGRPAILST